MIQIKVSAGLAMAPRDGVTRDELTRHADLALRSQAAPARHDGRVCNRDGGGAPGAALRQARGRERARRACLRRLLPADRQSRGRAIAGVEALLRWNHPERGAISPSEFVPVAEEAGLMDRLGEFVLRRAVADAARWSELYVSVNVSPVQVRDRAFVDLVSAVLRRASSSRPG